MGYNPVACFAGDFGMGYVSPYGQQIRTLFPFLDLGIMNILNSTTFAPTMRRQAQLLAVINMVVMTTVIADSGHLYPSYAQDPHSLQQTD